MASYTGNLSELIVIKVDPDTKAQLVQQAQSSQVSLSAAARLAIKAGLAAQQFQVSMVHHG